MNTTMPRNLFLEAQERHIRSARRRLITIWTVSLGLGLAFWAVVAVVLVRLAERLSN